MDGLHVDVRRPTDSAPREGVTLTLISRANVVLGTDVTNADGIVRFPAGSSCGTGATQPALVMAQDGTQDVALMRLTDPAFDCLIASSKGMHLRHRLTSS